MYLIINDNECASKKWNDVPTSGSKAEELHSTRVPFPRPLKLTWGLSIW